MSDIEIAEQKIAEAIISLRNDYIMKGEAPDVMTINHGLCACFADDIADHLPEIEGLQAVDIAGFIEVDPETGCSYDSGGPFDLELIGANWPNITPPEGLTWEDMNQLSEDAGFSCGTHVFLTFNGKFYDAEAEQGVDTPFELPFFQRVIASWLEERPQPPSL